jgi:hypothetical protein
MIVNCHFQSWVSADTHSLGFFYVVPRPDGTSMEQLNQVTDVLVLLVYAWFGP